MKKLAHHSRGATASLGKVVRYNRDWEISRTVNSNGNGLRESKAILTEEGGDLAKLVGLEVLDRGSAGISLNDVELNVVGLCHSQNGGGAGVALEESQSVRVLQVSRKVS